MTETIAICITTAGRNHLLAKALDSSAKADAPPYSHVEIIVVDNTAGQDARQVVADFSAVSRRTVIYEAEPRRGVAEARNRALDAAHARGARWVAFVDDDAEPDGQWLSELALAARRAGAHLAGGANLLKAPEEHLTPWQNYLCRGLIAHAAQRARWNRRQAERGGAVTITTGNWFADLDWIGSHGLRFDPSLSASGGEDTAFDRAMRKSGAKIIYVADSLMVETLPASRASLRYQFQRRLNSGIVKGRQYRAAGGLASAITKSLGQAILTVLAAGPLLVAAVVLSPVHRSGSAQALIALARMAGRASGLVGGAFGLRSRQYGPQNYAG